MQVSQNEGIPKSSNYVDNIFHHKPTILGDPNDYGNPQMSTKQQVNLAISSIRLTLKTSIPRISDFGILWLPELSQLRL